MSPEDLDRPRVLAIAFDGRSTSPMDLADALRGLVELVWVIDSADPTLGQMTRLLPRLGPVVDRTGRSIDETVADLRARVGTVDGVIAFSDAQLGVAAHLSVAFGLPGNSPETVDRLNDKYAQRSALAEAGLPTPGFVRIPGSVDPSDVVGLTAHLSYPLVLKPLRGDSSSDVFPVATSDQLVAAFASGPLRGRSPDQDTVAEEYLSDPVDPARTIAPYVSVESLVVDGRHVPLAISGRFPLAEPFRETGDFMPHVLEVDEAEAVVELAACAAAALGVTSGALHTEIKLTADGPTVIEVNGRVAGGGINMVYAERHGISLTVLAASVALGREVQPPDRFVGTASGPFTYRYFVQPPTSATTLVSIGNVADLVGQHGVETVAVNRSPGDALDWRAGSQGYVLRIGGTAVDRAALAAVPATVAELIDVSYG